MPGPWENELDAATAVINLAGEQIAAGRWTPQRKQLLVDSRVNTTRLLVQAMGRCSKATGLR
jgi:NAD dependent epimerase/dehydratase family enzyme